MTLTRILKTCRCPALGLLPALAMQVACPGTASAADLTFYAYSDCHFGAGEPPKTSTPVVKWINKLPGTPYPKEMGGKVEKPRAVIMSGDLVDHGADAKRYPEEWKNYIAQFGVKGEGECKFPVFESMGNHDWNPNMFVYDKIKERNKKRLELGMIDNISENGYHYSWNWDGIHFVNLNIFPGNIWEGEADTYSSGAHDPMLSRDFLEKDLREKVGKTGRPVILVHHFRPVDDNWWTFSAADKYQRIIQNYNVIMIMVGHQGGGVSNKWRGINWASSNGVLEVFRVTPDNILSAIPRMEDSWKKPFRKKIYFNYEDSGLPAVINNGKWTSGVSTGEATLHGKILYDATPASEVTIFWGGKDGGTNPDDWDYSVKLGKQAADGDFQKTISGLKPWTRYYYRAQANNNKGTAWAAASIPFVTDGVLPGTWDTEFIGYEQRPWGGAHLDDKTLILRGSGRDIGERGQKIDNFQYACTMAGEKASIQSRLLGIDDRTRDPMAGIMFRESKKAGSPSVSLLYSKDGVRLFSRAEADGKTEISPSVKLQTPVRLKLERDGDSFAAHAASADGDWEKVGKPVTVKMADKIAAGLALTAGNRDGSELAEAKFNAIQVK